MLNKKSLINIVFAALLSSGIFGCDNRDRKDTPFNNEQIYSCNVVKRDFYSGVIGEEKVTYSFLTYSDDITEATRFYDTRMLRVEARDGTKIEYLAHGGDLGLEHIVITKGNISHNLPASVFRDTDYFKEQQIKFIEYIKLIRKEKSSEVFKNGK